MGSSKTYTKLLLINNLNLPDDINMKIKTNYKYKMMQNKFKRDMDWCIKHIGYYEFLKNKINRKHKSRDTLLKTIRTYDYFSPVCLK